MGIKTSALCQLHGGRVIKICKGCNENKTLDSFSLHAGFKDGRNSKCKACKSAVHREAYAQGRYKATPWTYKKHLKEKYGLTMDQYDGMYKTCNGLCQICGSDGKLNVDHCHETGKVRGLLCTRCNTGLGKFGDSIENLLTAIKYLEGGEHGVQAV